MTLPAAQDPPDLGDTFQVMRALYALFKEGGTTIGDMGIIASAKPTYAAWNTALDYSAYATPTDMVGLVNPAGSGKVIKVISAHLFPRSTSASTGATLWQLLKRTTLNTGGTFTSAPAILSHDSADAAAIAAINIYTAAPGTLGTSAGPLLPMWVNTSSLTSIPAQISSNSTPSTPFPPLSTLVSQQKLLTLRPNESLYWNFSGAALPSGFAAGWGFIWTEEPLT